MFLLNHPFVQAQVKALTQCLAKQAPTEDRGKIEWLYQLLYSRPAGEDEIKIALAAIASASAGSALTSEAWEQYCQVLLCANEFTYVD